MFYNCPDLEVSVKKIIVLAIFAAFLLIPSTVRGADCSIGGNTSINLQTSASGELAAGDPLTYYLYPDPFFDWPAEDPVYVVTFRRIEGTSEWQIYRSDPVWPSSNPEEPAFFVITEGIGTNGEYSALVYDRAGGGNICSNFSNSFFISDGSPPPEDCVWEGQACCINELGQCEFPGNICCNICEPDDPGVELYCDFAQPPPGVGAGFGTVRRVTAGMCGYLDQSCCYNPDNNPGTGDEQTGILCGEVDEGTQYLCFGSLQPSHQGPGCICTPYEREEEEHYINTAIGCVPVFSTETFVGFVFRWVLGIAGGIGFLLIVYGAILILTSGGERNRIQQGKEVITASVAGVILIIFSVFVLRAFGVDILGLPGFG